MGDEREFNTAILTGIEGDEVKITNSSIAGIVKPEGKTSLNEEVDKVVEKTLTGTEFLDKPPLDAYLSAVENLNTEQLPELLRRSLAKGREPTTAITHVEAIGLKARCRIMSSIIKKNAGQEDLELELVERMHHFQALVETRFINTAHSPAMLRVQIMSELAATGMDDSDTLEDIISNGVQSAESKYKAYEFVLRRSGLNPDQQSRAMSYLQSLRLEYIKNKYGLRGEVMAYALCKALVEEDGFSGSINKSKEIVGKNLGVSDLEIIHVCPDFDRTGDGDLALVGIVYDYKTGSIQRDVLVVIDVKAEGSRELIQRGAYVKSMGGVLEPTVGTDTKYREALRSGSYRLASDFDPESVETKKPLTSDSDGFVMESGVPILAIRLPWSGNLSLEKKDGTMNIKQYEDLAWGSEGVTTSRHIIKKALHDLAVRSLSGRYE